MCNRVNSLRSRWILCNSTCYRIKCVSCSCHHLTIHTNYTITSFTFWFSWILFKSSCKVNRCFNNFRFCPLSNDTLNHISLNSGCSTFSYITSLTINIVSCSCYNLTFWTLTDFFLISKIFSWVFDIESCNRNFFFHNLVTSRYPHNSINRVYSHWWLFIWSSNTSSLIHRISCNSCLTSSSTLFCQRFFIFLTSRIFNKTFRWR